MSEGVGPLAINHGDPDAIRGPAFYN